MRENQKHIVIYTTQACGHAARHAATLGGAEARRIKRAMDGATRNEDALRDHGISGDHTYAYGTRAQLRRQAEALAAEKCDAYAWSVAGLLRRECDFA